jgi:hypothetical protein
MSVGQFLVDSIEHCRENDVKIEGISGTTRRRGDQRC